MHPVMTSGPWWRGRWFVRLLAVRAVGQLGDGMFQGALASYALFSDDRATAAELATAAAVVLLPYSLLGPYAGVLLDRWSRRQVLLLGNLLRALVVALLAAAVLTGPPDAVVYGGALVALGTNRFLLAGLSAALPHTVPRSTLTEANAVTPTLGTAAFVAGLASAGGLLARGVEEAGMLATAAVGYVLAGGLALLTPRARLGPDAATPARPQPRHLVAGLADGVRHLAARPGPATALAALAAMRLWFGLLTVSAVLSLRNQASDEGAAVAALGWFTVSTGAGFLAAALVTPWVAHRVGRGRTMVAALLVAAAAALAPAASAATWSWWVMGGLLGLGAQMTKICVDAVLQAGVDDVARGRVFALHDMAYNVAFVVAAGLAVVLLPPAGRSVVVLVGCAVGLTAVALAVAAVMREGSAPAELARTRRAAG